MKRLKGENGIRYRLGKQLHGTVFEVILHNKALGIGQESPATEGMTVSSGDYTVKRVEIHDGRAFLMPCNEHNTKYKPLPVGSDNDFLIWGVVTWVIKKV